MKTFTHFWAIKKGFDTRVCMYCDAKEGTREAAAACPGMRPKMLKTEPKEATA